VGLLNGPLGQAAITGISEDEVTLQVGELAEQPAPLPAIDLICALPRPQTLKKVLITAGMMGVRRLDLIRANRVEKSYYQSPLLEPDNFTEFLIEGISQGKHTRLPLVEIHERFRKFFEDTLPDREMVQSPQSLRLVADVEAPNHLGELYRKETNHILLAVGPEGGWVPFEIDLMRSIEFDPVSLGRWTLRVENAVNSALGQIELMRAMNS